MSPDDPTGRDGVPATSPEAVDIPFLDKLRQCVAKRRADGQSMALLFVDCGVIERIDVLWGYEVGDAARARMVATLGAEVLRPGDFVGVLGRDHLACVLSLVDGAQLAQLAAEKSLRTINAPLWLGEAEVYASASVGIAMFPGTADAAEELLRQARSACAAASGSASHIVLYDEEQVCVASLLVEEGRLRSAIAEDALELVFQPQFDLRFGQMMGVEAKLRWRDGKRELISMRDATAAAAAGGLATKMISSLLNRALRNCSEFRQRAGLDLRIAINLPARGLLEPGVTELVERALRTWALRPGRLMIEIDDVSSLQENAQAQAALLRLHEIGVKLSIDDARAPLSTLFWLATMPIQELKIDLSVTRDWTGQTRSEGVLRSLIELVHKLKIDVVAVGGDDEAAAARLLGLGCDFIQADFKGVPVNAEDFVARFADS